MDRLTPTKHKCTGCAYIEDRVKFREGFLVGGVMVTDRFLDRPQVSTNNLRELIIHKVNTRE
tara:strand:- start:516 stop:701 length:186 start_codon:yes stop_codon:yes gene_type:complete